MSQNFGDKWKVSKNFSENHSKSWIFREITVFFPATHVKNNRRYQKDEIHTNPDDIRADIGQGNYVDWRLSEPILKTFLNKTNFWIIAKLKTAIQVKKQTVRETVQRPPIAKPMNVFAVHSIILKCEKVNVLWGKKEIWNTWGRESAIVWEYLRSKDCRLRLCSVGWGNWVEMLAGWFKGPPIHRQVVVCFF